MYCTESDIRETNGREFFIGANTPHGFSFASYKTFCEENFSMTFIISGTPGCGKSTLMGRLSDRLGADGYRITKFHCSSDPSSLDALIIEGGKRYLIIDGTAPHIKNMKYPIASSVFVDLTKYIDKEKILNSKDEIYSLISEKAKCFESAYDSINSYATIEKYLYAMSESICLKDKILSLADKIIDTTETLGGECVSVYLNSLSMNGCIALDTFEKNAGLIYCIDDKGCAASVVLNILCESLAAQGAGFYRSMSPSSKKITEAVFIEGGKCLITTKKNLSEKGYKRSEKIGIKGFFHSGFKDKSGEIKLLIKCLESFSDSALSALSRAGKYHFALENIYSAAVDFSAFGELENNICNLICNIENESFKG